MDSMNSNALRTESTQLIEQSGIPSSPPPSYEHVLAESHVMDSAADNSADGGQDKPNEEEKSKRVVVKRPQIIHKSSKELYKAVAAQWGITCKMSDHCRCLDCQSHYLDCEYDRDEQEKTDGGLGAGTPMFLSELQTNPSVPPPGLLAPGVHSQPPIRPPPQPTIPPTFQGNQIPARERYKY